MDSPLQFLLGLFGLESRAGSRDKARTPSSVTDPRSDITPAPLSLPARLYQLGLPAGTPVRITRNRTVMLSWTARAGLRIHAGYVAAPDDVLRAVVRYLRPRLSRADRAAARRTFMAFPPFDHAESRSERARRPRTMRPEDAPTIARLQSEHARLNALHFDNGLAPIAITLSARMRQRLGELRAARDGSPVEITLSSRHIRRDGWALAIDTLLHEMVHQWQAERGLPLDHGTAFRQKAREVGIVPRAVADLAQLKIGR